MTLLANHEEKFIFPRECLARYAVRISILDSKRCFIHESELSAANWNIRVRADGPLAHLMDADPYFQNLPASIVQFDSQRKIVCFLSGPFAEMMERGELGFSVSERFNRYVTLSIGVREFVARHPIHWGFILLSTATIWTQFEMPRDDEFINENRIEELVQSTANRGKNFFPCRK